MAGVLSWVWGLLMAALVFLLVGVVLVEERLSGRVLVVCGLLVGLIVFSLLVAFGKLSEEGKEMGFMMPVWLAVPLAGILLYGSVRLKGWPRVASLVALLACLVSLVFAFGWLS